MSGCVDASGFSRQRRRFTLRAAIFEGCLTVSVDAKGWTLAFAIHEPDECQDYENDHDTRLGPLNKNKFSGGAKKMRALLLPASSAFVALRRSNHSLLSRWRAQCCCFFAGDLSLGRVQNVRKQEPTTAAEHSPYPHPDSRLEAPTASVQGCSGGGQRSDQLFHWPVCGCWNHNQGHTLSTTTPTTATCCWVGVPESRRLVGTTARQSATSSGCCGN
jgi:hypothetical protein